MLFRSNDYQQGFAPRDFVPQYPHLWNGCIRAWCPSLGPTGSVLKDWSPFRKDGTLTNFTLSTAWTIDQKYSIFLNDSTMHVNCGVIQETQLADKLTLMTWFKRPAIGNALYISRYGGTSSTFGMHFEPGTVSMHPTNLTNSYGYFSISDDTNWHFAVMVFDGTGLTNTDKLKLYLDGVQTTVTFVGTIASSTGNGGDNFYIGKMLNTYSIALVDDIRLYNRVLSSQEIQQLYVGGQGRGIAYTPKQQRISELTSEIPSTYHLLMHRRKALIDY